MSEYKINRVSSQEPRKHQTDRGTTYYIKVMLDGHDKPVSIGKRAPDALKAGDIVNGTILPTAYDADNFKADFTPTNKAFTPRDQGEIKAQMAVKAAVQLYQAKEWTLEVIEKTASALFDMVDRVKNHSATNEQKPQPKGASWEAARERLKGTTPAQEEVIPDFDDTEPVNLDDIPF